VSTGIFIDKSCFVCGEKSKYPEVGVMHLGHPDYLDGRPADSHSSVIYMFIQQCPRCGYCSTDISSGNDRIKEIATSELYQKQAEDPRFPATANRYLCWAMTQEDMERFNEAGLAALYASWVCDDDGESASQAALCRSAALSYFEQALEKGQPFSDSRTDELLLLVDLYRRNGDFDRAFSLCTEIDRMSLSRTHELTSRLQQALCEEQDRERHRIVELADL